MLHKALRTIHSSTGSIKATTYGMAVVSSVVDIRLVSIADPHSNAMNASMDTSIMQKPSS
jgi:hypothetical protein